MVCVRTVTPGLGPHLCIVVVGKSPGYMLIVLSVSSVLSDLSVWSVVSDLSVSSALSVLSHE